ncbi:Metallo-beta-lactamase superfamily protein [Clostridium cavendishii DSM 21758]|uniref:Metallo-beta-lactamase superfamily protein n=1 Tax=Clostridium cavendishii DSM 21758 TaxID=1121302 RepID=A0A1M6HTS3_9CLOT|nr:MBL fold metallo-hydrolase [Clostridium cavendishii]SHJ25616.1 Metallo-beta-lactamase superfamily protein [Clostridium cavendishii DSM 21758]
MESIKTIEQKEIRLYGGEIVTPEIHFFDITPDNREGGVYGLCAIIKLSDGRNIMIDAYMDGKDNYSKLKQFLNNIGVNSIDILFTTHNHSDHIGNAVNLLNDYKIKKLYVKTPDWIKLDKDEIKWDTQGYYNRMISKANEVGTQVIECTDTTIQLSDIETMKILGSEYFDYSDYNGCSVNYIYQYKDIRVLFTGDSNVGTLNNLRGEFGKIDIYQTPHHGMNQIPETFLREIQSKVGVFGNLVSDREDVKPNILFLEWFGCNVYGALDNNCKMCFKLFSNCVLYSLKQTIKTNCFVKLDDNGSWGYVKDSGIPAENEIINYNLEYYYIDKNWRMARLQFFDLEGSTYYVGQDGILWRDKWIQKPNSDKWYWLKLNGAMAKSESVKIDGKYYNFDKDGICTNP